MNLGVVALRQGRRPEAAGFFRAALELAPEDEDARRWLSQADSGA